jgi:hypothetical protein
MNQLHVLNPVGYPINPLNAKLNPTSHLLALLQVHHILDVSRIRLKRVESVLRTELKHNLLNDSELQVGSLVRNVSHSCKHILTSLNNFVT